MTRESQLHLRKFEAADLDALIRLDGECFEPPFRFSPRSMQRYVEEDNAWTLLAMDEENLAGFVIVHTQPAEAIGYVVTIDVASDYRRRGLGQRLLAEAEQWLASEGGGIALLLHVYSENHGAIRFYEEAGYQRARVEIDFYGEGKDGLLYWKRLVECSTSSGELLPAEDVPHAADLSADATQLVFEVLIAAVEVVDTVEDGFAVGYQGSQD